jgi:hypothetical protein
VLGRIAAVVAAIATTTTTTTKKIMGRAGIAAPNRLSISDLR